MRFMVLVKADKKSEAWVLPDQKLLADMGKFNEELREQERRVGKQMEANAKR